MNFYLNHTLLHLKSEVLLLTDASFIMNKTPRCRFGLMKLNLKSLYASTHLPTYPLTPLTHANL